MIKRQLGKNEIINPCKSLFSSNYLLFLLIIYTELQIR